MKRIDFAIVGENGETFSEPGFVEDCSELPVAIMRAMEDYLDAHDGRVHLPLLIRVHPNSQTPTC